MSFATLLLCAKGTYVHLLPPLGHWYTSFFFLAGPGPPHEIAVSAFSRRVIGPCSYVFIDIPFLITPCVSPSHSRVSPYLLALALPRLLSFLLRLSCIPETSLRTSCLLGFLLTLFHSFSTTPPHLTPARPSVTLLPYSSMSYIAGNLFFGMPLTLYCHFNFLTALFVSSGYILNSVLNAVLLVVLGHATCFFSCCHLYCFQLFYELRAPFPQFSCIF